MPSGRVKTCRSVSYPSAGAFSRHCVHPLRILLIPIKFVIFVLVSVYLFIGVHLFVHHQSSCCVMCYQYKLTSMQSVLKSVRLIIETPGITGETQLHCQIPVHFRSHALRAIGIL